MVQAALSQATALTEAYSANSTVDLHRDAITLRMYNREYEPDLQTNLTVNIPNPNYNVRSRTRTGPTQNWQDGNEAQIEYLKHNLVNTPVEVSSAVDYRAVRRTPIDYLGRLRQKQLRTINTDLENLVVTALNAATISEITVGSKDVNISQAGLSLIHI